MGVDENAGATVSARHRHIKMWILIAIRHHISPDASGVELATVGGQALRYILRSTVIVLARLLGDNVAL